MGATMDSYHFAETYANTVSVSPSWFQAPGLTSSTVCPDLIAGAAADSYNLADTLTNSVYGSPSPSQSPGSVSRLEVQHCLS